MPGSQSRQLTPLSARPGKAGISSRIGGQARDLGTIFSHA